MRIAVLGLHIESSTFSPHRSSAADFEVTRGAALLERYPWFRMRDPQLTADVEWLPIVHARALPGGVVQAAAYRSWRAEIVTALSACGPVDGVLLDIHGAMSVDGLNDAEADLVAAVRGVIGSAPLISAAMDLHGNVSADLFDACDLLTCYRTAPHVDVWETRERAARNLVACLRAGQRPAKALVHIPVLLPGEMTSTRDEPARSLYAHVGSYLEHPGVLDVALWVGFAWADQPRCCAAVVVTGDDVDAVEAVAADLAQEFWEARREFAFVAPAAPIEECLDDAFADAEKGCTPFFISDSGDNPGAGGAGDVTTALGALLDRPQVLAGSLRVLLVSIVDPAAVAALEAHPLGSPVDVCVGGRIDARAPGPVRMRGTIEARAEDPDGGTVVSLRRGGLSVVITQRRMQFNDITAYDRLGLHPVRAGIDVVVVKMGYLEPDLHEIAADRRLALTPGGVDQDLTRLPYEHLRRPMFPIDVEGPGPPAPRVSPAMAVVTAAQGARE